MRRQRVPLGEFSEAWAVVGREFEVPNQTGRLIQAEVSLELDDGPVRPTGSEGPGVGYREKP